MLHIAEFSGSYLLLDSLYVEPNASISVPCVARATYRRILSARECDRSVPLVVRHGSSELHVPVGASDVPDETIEVPPPVVYEMDAVHEEQPFLAVRNDRIDDLPVM